MPPAGAGARQAGEADRRSLQAAGNIRVMTDATCTGLFSDNWLAVVKGNRLYKLRAKSVVIATGSLEQPAVFRHNDLPGVMMGSAAQRLIRHYGVRPGRRAVVLTANADGYGVALDLAEAGVQFKPSSICAADTGTSEAVTRRATRSACASSRAAPSSEMMRRHGKRTSPRALISRITGDGTCEKARAYRRVRSALHVRRLHADLAPAASRRRQVRLQQIDGDVRGGVSAAARRSRPARSPAPTISTP